MTARYRSPYPYLLFFIALTLLVFALPAGAQEQTQNPPPKEEPKADEPQKLSEEMIVTARKREETVQDVPISVAAPSESQLRDRGAETIEDIATNVAGFTVQNLGPGQSQVAMRGVSAGQIVRDQPGVKEQVGIYLDESVISLSLFTPDIDLFDLSRVEILRGPQGTLFGSGSLSGTVRYISNQPQLQTKETIGELTVSTIADGGQGGSAKAAVNIPIGDKAAARIAAYFTRYGGYVDAIQPNLSVDRDVNTGTRAGARIAFRFEPNENLSITPRLLYQQVDMDGWNRSDFFNILANEFTTTRPKIELGSRKQFTQFEEPTTDEFLLGDLNIGWKIGNNTLTSVTSFSNREIDVIRDATALTASITGGSIGLPANVYTLDAPLLDATSAEVFTQELRLSGANSKLNWVVGGFYSDITRDYGQSLDVAGFEALTHIPTAGHFGAGTDILFFSDLSYDFTQYAIFGEATLSVTDKLDLTGGVRWYNFDEDRVQSFDGIFADAGTTRGSTSADGFAPRFIATYKLSDHTRLNAQVAKGFRLGGINDPLNVPLCTAQDLVTFGGHDAWEDEVLWNYEVGSKSTFMEGKGSVNVSVFHADIEDLQATVTAGSCSSRVIFNVPKARTSGAELELEFAPSDSWDFALSATKVSAELRSTLTSTDATGHESVVAGIQDRNRLPTVPELQFAAASTWRWTKPWVAGYVTGVFQYVGSRYTQIGDQAEGFGTVNLRSFNPNNIGGPYTQNVFEFDPLLPSYNIVNVRFGFLKNNWDTALFVNNVTDEIAYLALDQERGTRARVGFLTNQPRTFGISTRFTF